MKKIAFELSRYFASGVINTIVGYMVFLIALNFFKLNPFFSNAISYTFGLLSAYILNLFFVFKYSSHSLIALVRFFIGFGFSYAVNMVVFNIAITHLEIRPEISQIFAMLSYTICFYLINKFFVWKK
jgi:putative flippase GtrA